MSGLLEKLKLVQHFEAELRMTPEEFHAQMEEKIDREPPGFFSDSFDAWRSHKNNFKGLIENDSIRFKHRNTLFNQLLSIPVVHVSFIPNGKNLKVRTTIKAFTGLFMVIQMVGVVGFFAVFFSMLLRVIAGETEISTTVFAICAAGVFFIGFPYGAMIWSLSRIKEKIVQRLYPIEGKVNSHN